MRGLHLLLFAASVIAAGATIECGHNGESCDAGSCGDASAVPPVSGGGCDSSKPASQGGCAVDDSDGFFVSPTGSDGNAGSKTAPFQTIAKGISAAAGSPAKPNVYVCQGTYAENLVIQNASAGVALHGGFDCTSWAQTSAPTTVAPAYKAGAYVLSVAGAAALVESMTLTAPDATDPGASSIAALVNGSPGMTFRRAAVTAGAGANGATPAQLPADAPNKPGIANSSGNTCPSVTCTCASDTTTGGNGGGYFDGGTGFTNPSPGLPVIPSDPDAGGTGNPGGKGANGLDGTAGTSTGTLGELTATGWIPSPGGAGAVGGTAQGGGGAFGDPGVPTAGGGGGACGGCGGKGGSGGGGGGASIAVAALNSTLRVQGSTIRAGKGGSGGNGGPGQPGQPGGTGGTSLSGNGGNGGAGGAGGAGGGGAGGISVAIATAGTTPDIDTFSTVLSGTAGQGGTGGSGTKGIDGIAAPIQGF